MEERYGLSFRQDIMRGMLLELVLPLGILAMLASMLLPLPALLLDLLLIGNLLFALVLLVSALYITEPMKMSALPTIILLATLYRLSLNVATTRVILSGGDVGEAIEAFGNVVAQGNLVVGVVVFLVITLVQFIVIAKGSERVAEVSARFTLDALPGKQMSIDADVRAGLIDFETARRKRQELQTESRFYGALDGAMKFVKGDAIAGIIIVFVNVVGGFFLGVAVQGLEVPAAFSKYTLFSIGDGLLAQIPALLNSLAAGMIVTRVVRGDDQSLALEIPQQLGQIAKVKIFIGCVALALAAAPGMPGWPPLLLALFIFGSLLFRREPLKDSRPQPVRRFEPRTPPVLAIRVSDSLAQRLARLTDIQEQVDALRQEIHEHWGLLVPLPELLRGPELNGESFEISLRGLHAAAGTLSSADDPPLQLILDTMRTLVTARRVELVDDIHTRRLLDQFERLAPELVAAVVPEIATVTRLSELLKALLQERVSVRNLDIILQSVAEQGKKVAGPRELLREVRVALGRIVVAPLVVEGVLTAVVLHPLVDYELAQVERGERRLDPEITEVLVSSFSQEEQSTRALVVSKESRALVRECLNAAGIDLPVVAFEEIPADVKLVRDDVLCTGLRDLSHRAVERLAA